MDLPFADGVNAGKYFVQFTAAESVNISPCRVPVFRNAENRHKPNGNRILTFKNDKTFPTNAFSFIKAFQRPC